VRLSLTDENEGDRHMRTSMRVRLGLGLALAAFFGARGASATTVLEVGDNGSEQMGRGGAWVARASDPLAAFYNPAGLAGQETRLTLQANINIQSTCFTRQKASNDGTVADGDVKSATSTVPAGSTFPQVCNQAQPFPDPQIAFTYRVTPRLGIGLAIVAPSAAGQQTWPSTQTGADGGTIQSPQRYLLISENALVLTPALGIGWEPIDRLRIGASFIWGVANLDISNDSWGNNQGGVNANGTVQTSGPRAPANDVLGEIKVSSMFIPGFTAGVIYSPIDNLDIAGWYKFMSTIDAKGSVKVTYPPGGNANITDTTFTNCNNPGGPALCKANDVEVKIPLPMEAKVGFRWHQPRAGVEQAHRRDPMATDLYDVEADFTWANDSAFQQIGISLPGIPVNIANGGTGLVQLPTDASIPHNFKDVYGVRLGSDINVLPDQLAVRAGGYYQTAAATPEYQNIDFVGEWEFGLALGATYRVHFGHESTKALEISAGFGHTFVGTSSYTTSTPQQSGVHGLAGTQCNGTVTGNTNVGTTGCSDGVQSYRTEWPVNLGTITNSFNQINLGLSYRF
jgi:long-subunit fatty acid transport protein